MCRQIPVAVLPTPLREMTSWAGRTRAPRIPAKRKSILLSCENAPGHITRARCAYAVGSGHQIRILSEEDIATGARRVRARSPHPLEDLALYYLLLATGARPLEIARFQVSDYLAPDGVVRASSELRAELAITGRARPLRVAEGEEPEGIAEKILHHDSDPDVGGTAEGHDERLMALDA